MHDLVLVRLDQGCELDRSSGEVCLMIVRKTISFSILAKWAVSDLFHHTIFRYRMATKSHTPKRPANTLLLAPRVAVQLWDHVCLDADVLLVRMFFPPNGDK